jgi:hypothetical protein
MDVGEQSIALEGQPEGRVNFATPTTLGRGAT